MEADRSLCNDHLANTARFEHPCEQFVQEQRCSTATSCTQCRLYKPRTFSHNNMKLYTSKYTRYTAVNLPRLLSDPVTAFVLISAKGRAAPPKRTITTNRAGCCHCLRTGAYIGRTGNHVQHKVFRKSLCDTATPSCIRPMAF